ncbi:hypothetical protein HYY27_03240, partial [bacterium]|nr:hypothetical protein [bacterium]
TQGMQQQQQGLIEMLSAPTPWGVTVRGQVGPATTVRLLQFRRSAHDAEAGPDSERRTGEASVDLDRRAAYLRVVSPEGEELALNLSSMDGTTSEKKGVSQEELSSVRVSLKGGLPVWEGIQGA